MQTHRRNLVLTAAVATATLAGCHTQYTGTWISEPGASTGDFRLGGMTLAPDGTYTAFANYGGPTRGFSGSWEIERVAGSDVLVFQPPRPGTEPVRYDVAFDAEDDDVLLVTDRGTNTTTRLLEVEHRHDND
ncbi:MAG: hypothetical protein AAFU70_04700 [Planctomycetota bacterium]